MKPKFTTVILAAGLSRRMGEQNKLLLPVNGVAMIRHMVLLYQQATQGRVHVITGHDAARVEAALDGTGAQITYNPDYEQGQQTSVTLGLRVAEDADALLIGLGDQPLITREDLAALMSDHMSRDTGKVSIPMQGDQRGNPIIIPENLRPVLLADPKGPGCKKFTRTHLDLVQQIQTEAVGFFSDIDTPDAYGAFISQKMEVSA